MIKRDEKVKVLNVEMVTGMDLKLLCIDWEEPMQKVTTDKGVFYDNKTKTDWFTKIDQTMLVEIQDKINEKSNVPDWIREK